MAASKPREQAPPQQLRALAQALEHSGPARAYAFRGEELWFREHGIELVLGKAKAAGFELARHDPKDPDFQLARLLDDLGTAPLFATERCVVVRNVDPLLEKVADDKGRKGESSFLRSALAFLGRGQGTLVLAGGAGALRSDGALARAIVAAGGALVGCRRLFDSPPPWNPDPRQSELVQWLGQRAREKGLRLSPDETLYLAAATGNDLGALDTQLEKLRLSGGRGVRELVRWESGGTPWGVADELLAGRLARSLAAIEALFRSGFHSDRDGKREVDPAALSAMLLGNLRSRARQLHALAHAMARGASFAEASARAGGKKSEKAQAGLEAATRARGERGWRMVCEDVRELDRKSRTGAELDAGDFARLALRWRLEQEGRGPQPAQPAPRAGRAPGGR